MSCNTKKRPPSHVIGDKGINVLRQFIPESWVIREYSKDYGIDLDVELFSEETQCTLGEHVLFQVKAVDGVKIKRLNVSGRKNVEKYSELTSESCFIDVVQFSLDTKLLSTVETMGSAVVVLLALVDVNCKKVYLVCLNDYIEKVVVPNQPDYANQDHITVNIPTVNCLNEPRGREIIEWYGKRAKLFSFFNKVNYQTSEIECANPREKIRLTLHFIKILERLDVWSASRYWQILDVYLQEMKGIKDQIIMLADAEIVEERPEGFVYKSCNPCNDDNRTTLFQHRLIDLFWRQLNGISHVFEEIGKERFLPTEFNEELEGNR